MSRLYVVVTIAILMRTFIPGLAQADSGLYLSGELGANFAPGLGIVGDANDRASVCDEFINPDYQSVSGYLPNINCTGPRPFETWMNDFNAAEGILVGAALGYRPWDPGHVWGSVRLELEYFYRESAYNETADALGATGANVDKLARELITGTDRVDRVTSHNLFGNLYFDFANNSRFTPYIGIGVGVGFTDVGYGYLWERNADPTAIATGEGLPNADVIRRNLAGTISSHHTGLADTLFGYQVLFGLDYAFTESMSLGVKGRWVDFDTFREDGLVGDLLRSHEVNLRLDGSEPVSYGIETGDIKMLGVSLNLKYRF